MAQRCLECNEVLGPGPVRHERCAKAHAADERTEQRAALAEQEAEGKAVAAGKDPAAVEAAGERARRKVEKD